MSTLNRFRNAFAAPALALSLVLAAPAFAASSKGPDTVADVAEKVMDAVVNISTSQNVAASRSVPAPQLPPGSPFEDFFDEFFKRRQQEDGGEGQQGQRPRRVSSLGSGFVIDPTGYIVTNNHVIADADEIYANFNDGSKLKAELIGRDTKTDLALLKVTSEKPLVAVKFGDSDRMRVGDWVMAIGNPFGLGGTLTVGVISARNRDINSGPYDNFLQTDAAINRGNSGGPLFNMEGDVIGVNTAIISPSGGSIGIGFAVPSATVNAVIAQLQQFKEVRRGWIGVRIQTVSDEIAESLNLGKARGALVGGLNDSKSPAAVAGLKAGDVIVKFDGKDVKDVRDLPRIVADTPVGKQVDIVVIRKGKEETLKITVARAPEEEKAAAAKSAKPDEKPVAASKVLGLEVAAITDDLRKKFKLKDTVKGVVITSVDRNSAAADKGLKAGQVIVEVGQEPVSAPADLQKRVDALKKDSKKSALLLISDGEGQVQFAAVPLN
ncbi:serine protease [Azorhizobium oxalatiphilum]|uniref:Probable periplasmic serine endoprotease DegP-like n=1 Tax=Azorhizobium oxalatiphilum TaxID=980631 RepID=A0A917BT88_9HYPH|nr:DegQ family serine endoprotease [Azorhizobium oxalatiphilum]GGF57912.1 serine protease [Azorhizobium oxalatiphilum]